MTLNQVFWVLRDRLVYILYSHCSPSSLLLFVALNQHLITVHFVFSATAQQNYSQANHSLMCVLVYSKAENKNEDIKN